MTLQIITLGILTLLLFIVWLIPAALCLVTLLVSLLVLGRIERDRNLHDLAFYATGPLPERFKRWLHRYGYAESVVRSMILGLLALIQASGTNNERKLVVGVAFCVSVVIGFVALRWMQRSIHLDVRRWGYVRLSVLLGMVFSLMISPMRTELTFAFIRDVALELIKKPDFNRAVEIINVLSGILNSAISYLLTKLFSSLGLFGELIALILTAVLTTDVVFGFVVVAYSMLFLELSEKMFGKSTTTQSPRATAKAPPAPERRGHLLRPEAGSEINRGPSKAPSEVDSRRG